ncbi:MAG: ATP-binding protein [Bacteroidota bacterium]
MKYPIGIQDFQKLQEGGYLYIDKTEVIHKLLTAGQYYFLSRPRRFGKSLLLSTIKYLFQGKKELFDGLWIGQHWNWKEQSPVIHLRFSSMDYQHLPLGEAISNQLLEIAQEHNIDLEGDSYKEQFRLLIRNLSTRGKVALLIDEYDKPIIDYLDKDLLPQAKSNQGVLKTFYSVIKDSDPYIRFLMVTGVSKFSKVSIFSELNNLKDITLHRQYATLVGYTQDELEEVFDSRIEEISEEENIDKQELLARIKKWYNGYSWDGKNFLYNPFSALSYFDSGEFHNYWFATGTPTFLINLLKERMVYKVEAIKVGMVAFDGFDPENIDTTSLLFQTGYLTIKAKEEFGVYLLDVPNQEVQDSLLQYLLGIFSYTSQVQATPLVLELRMAFLENSLDRAMTIINGLLKSIPSHIFLKDKEAYYHSVVFLVFQYLGLFIEAEVHTSDGRMDAVVQTDSHIYILEFKLDESAESALEQIREKKYAEKFHLQAKPIISIGINFSSETKSIEAWKTAKLFE